MRKLTSVSIAILILCASLGAFAQDKPVNVGWVYFTTPKPGMTRQLEEGRKRHMDFHRKQNDSWRWNIWQIETGENTGSYLSVSFGHSWQDLDAWEQRMGPADITDGNTNMVPYVGTETASIWALMTDFSHMAGNETPKLAEANHFLLKPEAVEEFKDSIKKINDAIGKSNWPISYEWYELQDGGEGPHYVLLIYMKGWADLAGPNPSFPEMLEKAVGRHDAEFLMHGFDKNVKREWTETIRYRADLSYVPAR